MSWDLSPRVMEIKINRTSLNAFTKETINTMKRQSTEWEKIFPNDATNKRLISKINCLYSLISNKSKNLSQKSSFYGCFSLKEHDILSHFLESQLKDKFFR